MKITTPSGLGDAVLCYPIVKELAKREKLFLYTKYPEVFGNLDVEFLKEKQGTKLRYTRQPGTNYYEDLCACAGIKPPEFVLDSIFPISFPSAAFGKPVCLIHEPSTAHMHRRQRDFSLTPDPQKMQRFIDENKDRYFFVTVEWDDVYKERLKGIDRVFSSLSVSDYLALCFLSTCIASQIGHLIPIGQAMGKRTVLFTPEKTTSPFVRFLTPEMVIVKNARVGVEVL